MKSITVFECNVCKRTIERVTNIHGLEVVGNCIITNGCRGKLTKVKVKKGYSTIRHQIYTDNLTDFVPKRVVYNHQQTFPSRTWIVKHNLNNNPSIQTFIHDTNYDLVEVTAEQIFIDPNTTRLEFLHESTGVAQCLVRSTTSDQTVTTVKDIETTEAAQYIQLSSNNGYVTFASDIDIEQTPTFQLQWTFTSPVSGNSTSFSTPIEPSNAFTPWVGVDKVVIKGKRLRVYTVKLPTATLSGIELGSVGYVFKQIENQATHFSGTECLLLLTNAPYTEYDKNLSQYAISTTMNPSDIGKLLVINKTEIDINTNTLKNIFPYIKISDS